MRALVMAYAHAVEANHLELAMTYVHDDSPHRQRLETELDEHSEAREQRCLELDSTHDFLISAGEVTESIYSRVACGGQSNSNRPGK